ncbi:ActS/PrrB/RegB family redox-sensitive histidine kinase [Stappia taiwanensis]|uniref:histidine kinase n=1 Tax=Stappia taiwanensis TaxID=992267 RepID=A0A838XMP5_9HYPH|nr:ActS/PrrB/RegB family redox-sensitive histidine kinase [Stappia taiwanensis]MBA4611785.1 ActS/PrrB/RegB family redox-sensitive histidine kinase [Stappia taiwanensis]GGF02769.1 ATPase [Stappia taiwanensis]
MSDIHPRDLATSHRRLKLDTLVRLRWLAIAGQTSALLVVHFILEYPLQLSFCFALVAASAWINIFLKIRQPQLHRLSERSATLQLAYDLSQLGGLLALTGGLGNPFAFLLLAPVMVSAAGLSAHKTVLLGILATAIATFLAWVHLPLPWPGAENFTLPPLYLTGVWVALVLSLCFMGAYAFRVAEEARQLSDALTASELVLAREHHLHALDGLAAAAAHELGTPLATIYLTAKELSGDLQGAEDQPVTAGHREDIALILSQAERCREILSKLSSLSDDRDQNFQGLPLSHLIEEVVEPCRAFGVAIDIDIRGEGPEPIGLRNPAIPYGLGNLLENAIDFADSTVKITARWDAQEVRIEIADDGTGFAPDVITRLGEPYVTARGGGRDARPGQGKSGGGLGLGFFIAKTLLERTGADLRLRNRPPPAKGAVVRISWPRLAMDGRQGGAPAWQDIAGEIAAGSAPDRTLPNGSGSL